MPMPMTCPNCGSGYWNDAFYRCPGCNLSYKEATQVAKPASDRPDPEPAPELEVEPETEPEGDPEPEPKLEPEIDDKAEMVPGPNFKGLEELNTGQLRPMARDLDIPKWYALKKDALIEAIKAKRPDAK